MDIKNQIDCERLPTVKEVTVDRIATVVNNNTRIAEAGRRVLAEIDKNPQLAEDLAALFGIKQ